MLPTQPKRERRGHSLFGCLRPPRFIFEGGLVSHGDVLTHEKLITHEVLKDDTDAAAKGLETPFAKVGAVQGDVPRGWGVQPRQQFDQRGLPGSVLAYERELSPRW